MEKLEDYSAEEFEYQLSKVLSATIYKRNAVPVVSPFAVLLGGQSGAGKTALHKVYGEKLNNNVVVINGDEYRSYHPRYREIGEVYGIDAPAHTAAWSGHMVEAVINMASRMKYNLIIEGTLRTSEVPLKTAQLLSSRGYHISLALMAVKPDISFISCQLRWEQMRLAGTLPRAVDPEHHRAIVESIVDNLTTLEQSELFEVIELYARDGRCLFVRRGYENPEIDGVMLFIHDCSRPSEALNEILFGSWTKQERLHFAYLKNLLEATRNRQEEHGE